MSDYKIRFLSPSLRDLDRIAEYHLKYVGPLSAEKITNSILDRIKLLEDHPKAGEIHPDTLLQKQGYRKLLCFDYICIYRVIDEDIIVYRIVHGATDYPKYF